MHALDAPAGIRRPVLREHVVTGERTFMPLGVTCTYDSPDDAIGPQTVQNPNWPATAFWVGSTIMALYGASLAFRLPARSL